MYMYIYVFIYTYVHILKKTHLILAFTCEIRRLSIRMIILRKSVIFKSGFKANRSKVKGQDSHNCRVWGFFLHQSKAGEESKLKRRGENVK